MNPNNVGFVTNSKIPLPAPDSPTWPHVLAFACRMEAKLAMNRHKGDRAGWLKDHPWNLVERILDETVEVQQCFTAIGAHTVNLTRTPEETADECADVANFCMMLADKVTASENPENPVNPV
jgi:NTP pyrophosphatase (non-canonical NTP hydrolase)